MRYSIPIELVLDVEAAGVIDEKAMELFESKGFKVANMMMSHGGYPKLLIEINHDV